MKLQIYILGTFSITSEFKYETNPHANVFLAITAQLHATATVPWYLLSALQACCFSLHFTFSSIISKRISNFQIYKHKSHPNHQSRSQPDDHAIYIVRAIAVATMPRNEAPVKGRPITILWQR